MLGEGRKKRGKEHQSIWQRQSAGLSWMLQKEGEVKVSWSSSDLTLELLSLLLVPCYSQKTTHPPSPWSRHRQALGAGVNWDTEQQLHSLLFPCLEGEGSGLLG